MGVNTFAFLLLTLVEKTAATSAIARGMMMMMTSVLLYPDASVCVCSSPAPPTDTNHTHKLEEKHR